MISKGGIKDDLVATDWSLLVPERLSSKSLKFFPGHRKSLNKVKRYVQDSVMFVSLSQFAGKMSPSCVKVDLVGLYMIKFEQTNKNIL